MQSCAKIKSFFTLLLSASRGPVWHTHQVNVDGVGVDRNVTGRRREGERSLVLKVCSRALFT